MNLYNDISMNEGDFPLGSTFRRLALCAALATTALLSACGHDDDDRVSALGCDDGVKTAFKPAANTSVLLVREFKQGEPVTLANSPASPAPPAAPADVCLVKLLVDPGKPGTPGAPSTSAGIGIEVWLPAHANWNERIRDYGSGGWAGGFHTDITRIGGAGSANPIHLAAAAKGYVVGTSDHGPSRIKRGVKQRLIRDERGRHDQHRAVAGLLGAQHARAGREVQAPGQRLLRSDAQVRLLGRLLHGRAPGSFYRDWLLPECAPLARLIGAGTDLASPSFPEHVFEPST